MLDSAMRRSTKKLKRPDNAVNPSSPERSFKRATRSGRPSTKPHWVRRGRKNKMPTPSERRAARQGLAINDVPSNDLKQSAAQKEEQDGLQKQAVLKADASRISLNDVHSSNERTSDSKGHNKATSGVEGGMDIVLKHPVSQAQGTAREDRVKSTQATKERPAVKKAKVDVQSVATNTKHSPIPVKSSTRVEAVTRPALSNETKPIQPPMGPRRMVRENGMTPLTKNLPPTAPSAYSCIPPGRQTMLNGGGPLPPSHYPTVDSARYTVNGIRSEHVIVDKYCVANIVGKGGVGLKKIQQETGARILFVNSCDPQEVYKRCRIMGSPTAIEQAKTRIFLAEAAWAEDHVKGIANTNPDSQQGPGSAPLRSTLRTTRSQDHTDPKELIALNGSTASNPTNVAKNPLCPRLPPLAATNFQASQKSDVSSTTVGPIAGSPARHKSNTSSKATRSKSNTITQKSQQVVRPAEIGASVHPPLSTLIHGSRAVQHSSSPTQAVDQREPTTAPCEKRSVVPKDAVIIKLEDDTDSESDSFTGPRILTSLPKENRPVSAEVIPQWLNEEVQAILVQRKAEVKKAKRESRLQMYVLDYLGVSEEQMDIIQQRCNKTKNGTWDGNCLAVLGRKRIGKK